MDRASEGPFSQATSSWLELAGGDSERLAAELLSAVDSMRADSTIYPPQEKIFAAFEATEPESVRALVLGQDPYHGPGQAMGLAFSVPETVAIPPSLRNIFKELCADLSCPVPRSGDLTPWAKEGVLLLNKTLTVEGGKANSHSRLGWGALTDAIVDAVFALPQPVAVLAWGRPAIRAAEDARARAGELAANKCVLSSTHPSPLSASRSRGDLPAFLGSRPFSKANAWLVGAGASAIDWGRVAR